MAFTYLPSQQKVPASTAKTSSSGPTKMTKFRPCIDLHSGQVKQIVGGTLTEQAADLQTNYVSKHSAGYYAKLYREHNLTGSHVIMLGPGNEDAAKEALSMWPDGLQVGGGITDQNAAHWVEWGADKVIITSFLFPNGTFSQGRLENVLQVLGGNKERLVIDLSCRRKANTWFVAMNKWQTMTDFEVNAGMQHFNLLNTNMLNLSQRISRSSKHIAPNS
jgi:phosphoribosylformimino-5-aminoimidazole carboxamide ribotide isomerase